MFPQSNAMHDNNSFSAAIYRKKTFPKLYTKWDSFTLDFAKKRVDIFRGFLFAWFRCKIIFLGN